MKKLLIVITFTFLIDIQSNAITTPCTGNLVSFNFKIGNFNHTTMNGRSIYNDFVTIHPTNLPNPKLPDDQVFKTAGQLDVNKALTTSYGKRGVNGTSQAYYYFEWWTEPGGPKRCASNLSNSLNINSDGSFMGNIETNCGSLNYTTIDIVSQCHMNNPHYGASGIGFWWKTSTPTNINAPSTTVISPQYQGATNGTCILSPTPYGCNSTDYN